MEDMPVSFEDIAASRGMQEPDGCIPLFHKRLMDDPVKSAETGKREYKEVAYVKVLSPGNDKEFPDFRVTEVHQKRWPTQWKAFSEGKDVALEGTPLEKWHGVTPVETQMLKDVHVLSVEELAELPDSNLMNIGTGFLPLKTRAIAFLKSQDGEAGFMKLETENKVLQSQIDTQSEQIELLERKVAELLSAPVAEISKKSLFKGK